MLSTQTDITDIKQVQETQQALCEAIDQLPIMIDLWDEEDSLLYMNTASRAVNKERGIEIIIGMTWEDFVNDFIEYFDENKEIFEGQKNLEIFTHNI